MEFLKEKAIIEKENIQAISSNAGIFIKINDIEVWSDGFKKTFYFLLFLLTSLSVLAIVIFLIFFQVVPFIFLIVVAGIILTILLPWTLIIEKETAEWHGAEHKLIFLLITGSELNLENLKKAPIFIKEGCGDHNQTLKEPSLEKLIETLKLGEEIIQQLKM